MKILWLLVALHHHVLKHLHCLFLVHGGMLSSIPCWFPAILSHVFLLVTVITAKFSFWSSIIAALSLGFLWAVSLHMPGLVTGITIAKGVECVFTIRVEYSWPGRSRLSCCIDDQVFPTGAVTPLTSILICPVLPRWFSFPDLYASFSLGLDC